MTPAEEQAIIDEELKLQRRECAALESIAQSLAQVANDGVIFTRGD